MKAKLPTLILLGIALFLQLSFTESGHFIDSITNELTHAKNEIRRLHFQTEIAGAMDDRDSAVKLLDAVLDRSLEINERHLQLDAYKTLGAVYLSAPDLDSAAVYMGHAEFLAHEMHDTLNQAEATMSLARICSQKKIYKKSEPIFRQAEMLLQATGMPDEKYSKKMGLVLHQHAASLAEQDKLDSAQQYEERSIALFTQAGSNSEKAMGLASLASLQSRQNNHAGAIHSLNLSLESCTAEDDAPMVATGLSQLALEYSISGNSKMAQQKADSALLMARAVHAPVAQVMAFRALAAVKEQGNDYKQALHYYDSATVLNTQLLNAQFATQVVYEQKKQARQTEFVLAEQTHTVELRKTNMEVVGLGIFLLTALVFGVGISLKKHGAMVTKVLGAMALLLTFELISLIVNPLLEKWTHHSAVIMLLIMAAVAGILVSLHHQIEDLIRKWFHTEEA